MTVAAAPWRNVSPAAPGLNLSAVAISELLLSPPAADEAAVLGLPNRLALLAAQRRFIRPYPEAKRRLVALANGTAVIAGPTRFARCTLPSGASTRVPGFLFLRVVGRPTLELSADGSVLSFLATVRNATAPPAPAGSGSQASSPGSAAGGGGNSSSGSAAADASSAPPLAEFMSGGAAIVFRGTVEAFADRLANVSEHDTLGGGTGDPADDPRLWGADPSSAPPAAPPSAPPLTPAAVPRAAVGHSAQMTIGRHARHH